MKWSATPFYRQASSKTPSEDGIAINEAAGLFVVCDGVSGPYSPSNPGINYEGGITGGQMASRRIITEVMGASSGRSIKEVLTDANLEIFRWHLSLGTKSQDPQKEAVGGACVAACQIANGNVTFVVAGDSFAFCKHRGGVLVITNFDQAAFDFEKKGDEYFQECKEKCRGSIGDAWDMYFSYFAQKQFYRANKNLYKGGHAMFNGDLAVENYWTVVSANTDGLSWILLCTDGLLPQLATDPSQEITLGKKVGELYERGGIPAILEWRDKEGNQPHITGYPEASAIEVKFD